MSGRKNKKRKKNVPREHISIDTVKASLAKGKTQKAIQEAKQLLKINPSKEAEGCLAEAYQKRIEELQNVGFMDEALNLIEVAIAKCPNYEDKLRDYESEAYNFPIERRDVNKIIERLKQPDLDPGTHSQLNELLRRGLADPRDLADADNIDQNHPLKVDAKAVWDAFETVSTEAPEEERKTALDHLSKVSRRSPLANWCLWIRALDAYYRFDDSHAKVLLNKIPSECTLYPAVKILSLKIEERLIPEGMSSKPTRNLWKSLTPQTPHSQWIELHRLLKSGRKTSIRTHIKEIFFSAWVDTLNTKRIVLNAILFMLMEYDFEDESTLNELQRFCTSTFGKRGKFIYQLSFLNALCAQFPAESADHIEDFIEVYLEYLNKKEIALLYARAAELEAKCDEMQELSPLNFIFGGKRDDNPMDDSDAIFFFKKAIEHFPDPNYFESFVTHMKRLKVKDKDIESVLHQWNETNPNDYRPLIYLFENVEKRGALQKALNYLKQAEELDRTNPKVREGRQRLVWQSALKHLKQQKFHLVDKDISQIKSFTLPTQKEKLFNDLGLFASFHQNNNKSEVSLEELPISTNLLFAHLQQKCSLNNKKKKPFPRLSLPTLDDGRKLEIYYNFREALQSLDDLPDLPMAWFAKFPEWIELDQDISDELLLRISRTALGDCYPPAVIAATGLGLNREGSREHEFLFYRAIGLHKSGNISLDRIAECLEAAVILCQEKGDYQMEQQARKYFQKINPFASNPFMRSRFEADMEFDMTVEEAKEVFEYERRYSRQRSKSKGRKKSKPKQKKPTMIKETPTNLPHPEFWDFFDLNFDDMELDPDEEIPF